MLFCFFWEFFFLWSLMVINATSYSQWAATSNTAEVPSVSPLCTFLFLQRDFWYRHLRDIASEHFAPKSFWISLMNLSVHFLTRIFKPPSLLICEDGDCCLDSVSNIWKRKISSLSLQGFISGHCHGPADYDSCITGVWSDLTSTCG